MKQFFGILLLVVCCVSCCRPAQQQPVIGIVDACDAGIVRATRTYVDAVLMAGGIPVVVPLMDDEQKLDELFSQLDGMLLPGGGDVDPAYFHAERSLHLGTVNPQRDTFEFRVIDLAVRHKIPILGICRGEQMLNVAFGGTLYQDLPSEYADMSVVHMQAVPGAVGTHRVVFEKGSLAGRLAGADTLLTNSFHHQAVKDVAPGFRASARATDGTVEVIESTDDRRILGIQFHPEEHAIAGDTTMLKFIRHFVGEAAKRGR